MSENSDRPDDATVMAYARGRLGNAAAAELEAAASQDDDLRADIALFQGLGAARSEAVSGPGDLGWARLSRAIDDEVTLPAEPRAAKLRPLLQAAAVAIVAVGLWQVAIVPQLPLTGGSDGYVPVTETTHAITVAFAPTATEAEIRGLLIEIDAQIVGGPSAIGLWQIDFSDDTSRSAGLERLLAVDIVETVQAD